MRKGRAKARKATEIRGKAAAKDVVWAEKEASEKKKIAQLRMAELKKIEKAQAERTKTAFRGGVDVSETPLSVPSSPEVMTAGLKQEKLALQIAELKKKAAAEELAKQEAERKAAEEAKHREEMKAIEQERTERMERLEKEKMLREELRYKEETAKAEAKAAAEEEKVRQKQVKALGYGSTWLGERKYAKLEKAKERNERREARRDAREESWWGRRVNNASDTIRGLNWKKIIFWIIIIVLVLVIVIWYFTQTSAGQMASGGLTSTQVAIMDAQQKWGAEWDKATRIIFDPESIYLEEEGKAVKNELQPIKDEGVELLSFKPFSGGISTEGETYFFENEPIVFMGRLDAAGSDFRPEVNVGACYLPAFSEILSGLSTECAKSTVCTARGGQELGNNFWVCGHVGKVVCTDCGKIEGDTDSRRIVNPRTGVVNPGGTCSDEDIIAKRTVCLMNGVRLEKEYPGGNQDIYAWMPEDLSVGDGLGIYGHPHELCDSTRCGTKCESCLAICNRAGYTNGNYADKSQNIVSTGGVACKCSSCQDCADPSQAPKVVCDFKNPKKVDGTVVRENGDTFSTLDTSKPVTGAEFMCSAGCFSDPTPRKLKLDLYYTFKTIGGKAIFVTTNDKLADVELMAKAKFLGQKADYKKVLANDLQISEDDITTWYTPESSPIMIGMGPDDLIAASEGTTSFDSKMLRVVLSNTGDGKLMSINKLRIILPGELTQVTSQNEKLKCVRCGSSEANLFCESKDVAAKKTVCYISDLKLGEDGQGVSDMVAFSLNYFAPKEAILGGVQLTSFFVQVEAIYEYHMMDFAKVDVKRAT